MSRYEKHWEGMNADYSSRLSHFMVGFGAAVQLLRRAQNLGCFVEVVCLSTSVIDAMLRIGIILKYQIKENTYEVHNDLLYQSDDDRKITERAIYKRALQEEVVGEEQFNKLNQLYNQRNQIIHRYVISQITTKDVLMIAAEYDTLIDSIQKIIRGLEEKQISIGQGMTQVGPKLPPEFIRSLSDPKHGQPDLAEAIQSS